MIIALTLHQTSFSWLKHTHTLSPTHIFLCLTSTPFAISAGMGVFLYKDRTGDSIYYNSQEPRGLATSYFILMYLHFTSPPIFFPVSRKTSEKKRNNNGKAGDSVFTVSPWPYLGASISQQIKLPKLGRVPPDIPLGAAEERWAPAGTKSVATGLAGQAIMCPAMPDGWAALLCSASMVSAP